MSLVKSRRKPSGVRSTIDPVARVHKKLRRPMARSLSFTSAPIVVEVGDKKQKFFVHEVLVSASSEFFKSALKSEWKNNTTRSIALPDTEPVAFQIYLDWLYSGPHITITKKDDRIKSAPNATPSVNHEWTKWVACYELG
ncbi:hypothetical protein N0V86_006647 [Didymella sp. IMI 355093]|nr:hypothetical protein N0V86_006647 [Didymella sp. IMI 355093]